MFRLTLLAFIIVAVTGDQIVPAAFQKIFPKAAPGRVQQLTFNVNKQTVIAKAKTAVRNWMPYWQQVSIMVVDFDTQNKAKATARKKALAFIDYRFSLKKYINFLRNQAVNTKYLTNAEADSMKKIFWTADKKARNDYSNSSKSFMEEVSKQIKKTPVIEQQMTKFTSEFASKSPKDYANLKWAI